MKGTEMLGRFFRPGGRESTITTTQSEVMQPIYLFIAAGIVGDFVLFGLILIVFIVWWKMDFDGWWDWFKEWWTFLLIPLVGWWVSLPAVLAIIRLLMELWDRYWPPVRQAADPALGVLGPFQGKKKKDAMLDAYLTKFRQGNGR